MKLNELWTLFRDKDEKLPRDVITHNILPRLPIESLIRFKSVSKQWYSIISFDRYFAKSHLDLSLSQTSSSTRFLYIAKENSSYGIWDKTTYYNIKSYKLPIDIVVGLKLVGSYNGLVCLTSWTDDDKSGKVSISNAIPNLRKYHHHTYGNLNITLWNPFTRKSRKYHSHGHDVADGPGNFLDAHDSYRESTPVWGFGYVSSLDDYKVVRITTYITVHPVASFFVINVFSMMSKRWKRIESSFGVQERLLVPVPVPSPGLTELVNEVLYWDVSNSDQYAFAFDLVHETLKLFDKSKRIIDQSSQAMLCKQPYTTSLWKGGDMCDYDPSLISPFDVAD